MRTGQSFEHVKIIPNWRRVSKTKQSLITMFGLLAKDSVLTAQNYKNYIIPRYFHGAINSIDTEALIQYFVYT